VNADEVTARPDRIVGKLGAVCFWQSTHSVLNLIVDAVLRDSVWAVSLLPWQTVVCCILYACKVERFVLTILKKRLLLLLLACVRLRCFSLY